MSDPLTPAERAAIDAFPEDRVQRIARGTSCYSQPVWDGMHLVEDPKAPKVPTSWRPKSRKGVTRRNASVSLGEARR